MYIVIYFRHYNKNCFGFKLYTAYFIQTVIFENYKIFGSFKPPIQYIVFIVCFWRKRQNVVVFNGNKKVTHYYKFVNRYFAQN